MFNVTIYLLRYSGRGQAPSPDFTPNENIENLKLEKILMFKATRCIHARQSMRMFLEVNKSMFRE